MQLLRTALVALATVSFAGGVPFVAAQQMRDGAKVRRHKEPLRVQRETPRGEDAGILDAHPKPWRKWQYATGDWRGARPWLEGHGVMLELTYTGEVFTRLSGGIGSGVASEYRGNVDLTATVDTKALGLWSGGMFFVYFQNGHGSGLTKNQVGDVQVISNIDAADLTQISEYWFAQRLFADRVGIKLGKQDVNSDFCVTDYGTYFINSSFGVIPTVPMPTFPDPGLGAATQLDPTKGVRFGLGVYDGASKGRTSGFDTTFDGKGGTFGILELALRTSLVDEAWFPGTYRVGAWYHSDDVQEITDAPAPETFANNRGFYLVFDQMLLKEHADPEDKQGLGAFFQFGWAPEDRNELTRYVGGGLVYHGAVPGRDDDFLGAGVAHVAFGDAVERLEGLTHETVVEVFYQAGLTEWLALQPDLQFILNPGGKGKDAVAAGLRFVIDF